MLKKALSISFFLYLVSLLTSMAGMEIFGWLTFTLAMAVTWKERKSNNEERKNSGADVAEDAVKGGKAFFGLGADWIYLAMVIIVILGYLINAAPDTDFVFMIGCMRWGLLMYSVAYAARSTKMTEKAFIPLMIVATVVALHGIQAYFTGWDYIRNRSVLSYVNVAGQARSAGFFSMPTTFAHAISQTLCFPLAALVLGWARKRWQWVALSVMSAIIFVSLVMSFTRGAWVSTFCALGAMAFFVNRRLFVSFIAAVAIGGTALVAVSPVFRSRALSLFDGGNKSNSERMELWRANMWMFKEYPLLGIGLNDNERRTEEYNIKYGFPDAKVGNAHNTYVQWLSGTGILGLSAYLAFIGFYLWLTFRLWKVIPREQTWHRTIVLGALGAQIAVHVGGLTDCNFKDAEVQHQYITILGLLSYLRFRYLTVGAAALTTAAGTAKALSAEEPGGTALAGQAASGNT